MPSAKVYDRPADRKGPPLLLIALAIVVLVAAGFFVYKMLNPPAAAPVKTQSTQGASPHNAAAQRVAVGTILTNTTSLL